MHCGMCVEAKASLLDGADSLLLPWDSMDIQACSKCFLSTKASCQS